MMRDLAGQVAWVTGAGSGIGRAAAVSLAKAGMRLALTGRGREPLERTADLVRTAGGQAVVASADMGVAAEVKRAWEAVYDAYGRCDLLLNSAGLNVARRGWSEITPSGIDAVIGVNLNGSFYASQIVLATMRAQGSGLIIHVSSWAGRYVSKLTGPAYSASKHGLVALSESLNQEECGHGIRSCCICPGEVATPLLDKRPVPVTDEDKGRMLQADDLAETILFVARLPATVCVNEILISPTWNRGYLEGIRL